jgi:murein DD-endopeptidase MepM/ murein hydrolase activator NlpD
VANARMSSGFGMRRHPILGYHKMHQGVDFAAGTGTPVLSAGDGTVVEIRRFGGYGNWLRIRHAGGYESGYAHLSKYASGLSVGDKVSQGEVVAFVGSTGRSTGPHLHYEIFFKGQRIDPKGAKIPMGTGLESRELIAFRAQKKKVDQALKAGPTQYADKDSKKKSAPALRPAQKA